VRWASRTRWIFLGLMGLTAGCRLPPKGDHVEAPVPLPYEKAAGKFSQRVIDNGEGSIVAQAGLSSRGMNAPEVMPAGGRWLARENTKYRPGPQVPPQPLPPPTPWPGGDPHQRSTPTVLGDRLELGPSENPLERVVELTRELEALSLYNRSLQERIQQLETQQQVREQALAEAVRQVETATQEVTRSRSQIEQLQNEVAMLQAQIRQMEKEDVELLRAVISTLEKLLGERRGP